MDRSAKTLRVAYLRFYMYAHPPLQIHLTFFSGQMAYNVHTFSKTPLKG